MKIHGRPICARPIIFPARLLFWVLARLLVYREKSIKRTKTLGTPEGTLLCSRPLLQKKNNRENGKTGYERRPSSGSFEKMPGKQSQAAGKRPPKK